MTSLEPTEKNAPQNSSHGPSPFNAKATEKIIVRSPDLRYGEEIPVHYFDGRPVATHLVSGMSMLFPEGERYFIRNVKYWIQKVDDPELQKKVKTFFGQEAVHANEHEKFFQLMQKQGFPVERWLKQYDFVGYKIFEQLEPKILRLSITAAFEHFTAMMAEHMLTTDLLDGLPTEIRNLYLWHAAEEIEHKAVAFDVLKAVNPSYFIRVLGLIFATFRLIFFWSWATIWLMMHDKSLTLRQITTGFSGVQSRYPLHKMVYGGIRSYLRKDFHPDQVDNYEMARNFLNTLPLKTSR